MKKIFYLPIALLLLAAACSTQTRTTDEALVAPDDSAAMRNKMYAVMSMPDTVKPGGAVTLKFAVYNGTDSTARFLKWQTPFEPLLGKYLDVKHADGEEAQYVGAMAKRMMPPPVDAYISIAPGDSLVTRINLTQGYALSKEGRYTVHYNSEEMNGLKVDNDVSFVYH